MEARIARLDASIDFVKTELHKLSGVPVELANWHHAKAAWDTLQHGDGPCAVMTTTPAPEPALARLLAAVRAVRTGGASRANRHQPAALLQAIEAACGGTRLDAQEIEGELVAVREGSL